MSVQDHTHTFSLPTVPDWDDTGWVTSTVYTEGVALLHNGTSYQVKQGQEHTALYYENHLPLYNHSYYKVLCFQIAKV